MEDKNEVSTTAQYLMFVASGGDKDSIEVRYQDENIWLTQKMMAELYDVSVPAINQHLKSLFDDGEIGDSVVKKYLITAADGKNYSTNHYNLQVIISVGFKIENERAVQNKMHWATHRNTAAELIIERADSKKQNMGLTTRRIPMSMADWAKRLDGFLEFNEEEILIGAGKISHEQAKLYAESEFEKYRVIQEREYRSDFDRLLEGVVSIANNRESSTEETEK